MEHLTKLSREEFLSSLDEAISSGRVESDHFQNLFTAAIVYKLDQSKFADHCGLSLITIHRCAQGRDHLAREERFMLIQSLRSSFL
jgi:hypothetical protein